MGLGHYIAVAVLVWASGVLFGAGVATLRASPARALTQDESWRRGDQRNISGTLIWWVLGIAFAWAILVVIQELIASDFWHVLRIAIWTPS